MIEGAINYRFEYHVGMPPRQLLPIEEAARQSGLSKATLFRWLKAGLLTRYYSPIHTRRRTLIDPAEVRRLQHRPPGRLAD